MHGEVTRYSKSHFALTQICKPSWGEVFFRLFGWLIFVLFLRRLAKSWQPVNLGCKHSEKQSAPISCRLGTQLVCGASGRSVVVGFTFSTTLASPSPLPLPSVSKLHMQALEHHSPLKAHPARDRSTYCSFLNKAITLSWNAQNHGFLGGENGPHQIVLLSPNRLVWFYHMCNEKI